MSSTNYSTTLLLDQPAEKVFDAILDVRGWWSEEIEGTTNQLGGVFTYHYRNVHRCQMKLTELIPQKKIVWEVTDNYFNFTKDQNEWIGSKISFEIAVLDHKTQIRFTHWGLIPDLECFDICRNAWNQYIQQSLSSLILTGKGQPNKKNASH